MRMGMNVYDVGVKRFENHNGGIKLCHYSQEKHY